MFPPKWLIFMLKMPTTAGTMIGMATIHYTQLGPQPWEAGIQKARSARIQWDELSSA
jgi:hypothetical protein